MELTVDYTRKRRDFGIHVEFANAKPEILANIEPSADLQQTCIQRKANTVDLDCIPSMSEHWVTPAPFLQKEAGMQHLEGGWPKEVNVNEYPDKQRYLRKLENEDSYKAVCGIAAVCERWIEQNNTVDIYQHYFSDNAADLTTEPPVCKTLTVFRDPSKQARAVSQICWHPEGPSKLAVAYSVMQFQAMTEGMPISSYIWDVNRPTQFDTELVPQSPLCSLAYNAKSPDHIVGGSYNGCLAFWDLRKGTTPLEVSPIEKSHHDPIYEVSWIQSRANNECCSVSSDGTAMWWDVRKLGTGPMDTMHLKSPDEDVTYGATSLEYRSDAGATRFLVGTEQGVLMSLERKAKKDKDSQKQVKAVYGANGGKHFGPVYSVQRNPMNVKYFLTVGDWSAKVWFEDLKTPIMATKYDKSYLSAGCWSPTRPGVFFTTKEDGTMDIWDFYHKQNDPVLTCKVSDSALGCLSVQSAGRLVAVGSADGACTLMELCPSLYTAGPQEKTAINQMLERETKREKNLEQRSNQMKRMKMERDKRQKSVMEKPGSAHGNRQDFQKLEQEFYAAIKSKSGSAIKEGKDEDKAES